jgi:HK97 gp10 family phage protein
MAVSVGVSVTGTKELKAALERMKPGTNKKILRNSLIETAKLLQRDAAKNQILKGRGNMKPHTKYLTSRHGGAGIVGSIRVNRGPLPFAIEVGSDKKYAPIHEFGGTFKVRAHTRKRKYTGRIALSRGHTGPMQVKAHTMKMPKRSFLEPALYRQAPKFTDIVIKHWKKEAGL